MTVAIAAWTADGDSNDSFGLEEETEVLANRGRCCWSDWLEVPPSCEGVADKDAEVELSVERLDPVKHVKIAWDKVNSSDKTRKFNKQNYNKIFSL